MSTTCWVQSQSSLICREIATSRWRSSMVRNMSSAIPHALETNIEIIFSTNVINQIRQSNSFRSSPKTVQTENNQWRQQRHVTSQNLTTHDHQKALWFDLTKCQIIKPWLSSQKRKDIVGKKGRHLSASASETPHSSSPQSAVEKKATPRNDLCWAGDFKLSCTIAGLLLTTIMVHATSKQGCAKLFWVFQTTRMLFKKQLTGRKTRICDKEAKNMLIKIKAACACATTHLHHTHKLPSEITFSS